MLFGSRLEVWPQSKVRSLYFSQNYYHGVYDPDVSTLNPLNFTLGLARVARAKGVEIFERTAALNVQPNPNARALDSLDTANNTSAASQTSVVGVEGSRGGEGEAKGGKAGKDEATATTTTTQARNGVRRWHVHTQSAQGKGVVCADDVVLAGGSSVGEIGGSVGRALVPLLTFIM